MKKPLLFIAAFFMISALSACGLKGDLYLPAEKTSAFVQLD